MMIPMVTFGSVFETQIQLVRDDSLTTSGADCRGQRWVDCIRLRFLCDPSEVRVENALRLSRCIWPRISGRTLEFVIRHERWLRAKALEEHKEGKFTAGLSRCIDILDELAECIGGCA